MVAHSKATHAKWNWGKQAANEAGKAWNISLRCGCGVDGCAAADSDDFSDRDLDYDGEPAAQQDPAAIQATIPIWFQIHEYIGIDCSNDIFL